MALEIERKFLVEGNFQKEVSESKRITQGYLSSVPERSVRVRIYGDKGFLTIKGIANTSGTSRYEWEREIPISEAEELLLLCEAGVIDKIRHKVKVGTHCFEIDEFKGKNEGLIIAEIELQNENETFIKPLWLGKEVTGNTQYYNSQLSKVPFSEFSQNKKAFKE